MYQVKGAGGMTLSLSETNLHSELRKPVVTCLNDYNVLKGDKRSVVLLILIPVV